MKEFIQPVITDRTTDQSTLRLLEVHRELFLNPALSDQRSRWIEMLKAAEKNPQEFARRGYSQDVLRIIGETTEHYGLITKAEREAIARGEEVLFQKDALHKYGTWSQITQKSADWHRLGKKIGLVHGSFDPPHVGHAELLKHTKEKGECDVLLVGVNSIDYVRKMKEKPDDPKPRFPEFAWRLEQLASLPHVDAVFEFPASNGKDSEYAEIYKSLHIDVVGCGANNNKLDKRRELVAASGGTLLTHTASYSSTRMMQFLTNPKVAESTGYSLTAVRDIARKGEVAARKSLRK